jgi:hypothetical protein
LGSKPVTMHPPRITSPRFARSRVSWRGKPITNGTILGGHPRGNGSTSIGENVSSRNTAQAASDGRMSLPPRLMKSTQATTRKGRLLNRNAINQNRVDSPSTSPREVRFGPDGSCPGSKSAACFRKYWNVRSSRPCIFTLTWSICRNVSITLKTPDRVGNRGTGMISVRHVEACRGRPQGRGQTIPHEKTSSSRAERGRCGQNVKACFD